MVSNSRNVLRSSPVLALLLGLAGPAAAIAPASSSDEPAASASAPAHNKQKQISLDRSGKLRKGKASYYGRRFYGKKMANGKPMDPQSNVAASKTLPLGTKAKVTNLKTGKSDIVDIEDRGPYINGRIIDLSPKTAETLELKKEGVAPVEVEPLAVPQSDESAKSTGSIPPGAESAKVTP